MATEVYVSRCWLFFYTYEIIKSMAIVERSLNYFQQGLGSPVLHTFNLEIKNEAAQVKHRTSCRPGSGEESKRVCQRHQG